MKFTTICAWCGKIKSVEEIGDVPGEKESHGICEVCGKIYLESGGTYTGTAVDGG